MYYIISYCVILHYVVSYFIIFFYFVLFHVILHRITLNCIRFALPAEAQMARHGCKDWGYEVGIREAWMFREPGSSFLRFIAKLGMFSYPLHATIYWRQAIFFMQLLSSVRQANPSESAFLWCFWFPVSKHIH